MENHQFLSLVILIVSGFVSMGLYLRSIDNKVSSLEEKVTKIEAIVNKIIGRIK